MQAYDDNKRFQQTLLHIAVMLSDPVTKYLLPVTGTA